MHYLYLITTDNDETKIGISSDVERRFKEIQSSNPQKLILFAILEYPSEKWARNVELSLHRYYSYNLIRSEWFDIPASDVIELLDLIAAMAGRLLDIKVSRLVSANVGYSKKMNARVVITQWFEANPNYLESDETVDELHKLFTDATQQKVGRTSVHNVRKELRSK